MRAREIVFRTIVPILVFFSVSCRVEESKVPGNWVADASCVTVTLAVKADHSFIQTARHGGVVVNELTGRWISNTKGEMVTFRPFLDFLDDEKGKRMESASFPPENLGLTTEMGPVMFRCQDGTHELYYAK